MLVGLVCVGLCVGDTMAASPWVRGTYGKLAFAEDCKSYKWEYGANTFPSEPLSLVNVTGVRA